MKNKPFALKMQTIIIFMLLFSFLLIGQPVAHIVFTIGAIFLIFSALLQINFGNIDSDADLKRTIISFVRNLVIIAIVFAAGIFLAPLFLQRGFMGNAVLVIAYGTVGIFLLFIILGSNITEIMNRLRGRTKKEDGE